MMSINSIYTPEQLQGKFISCTLFSDGSLDCVRYSSGLRSGEPVLYSSINEAEEDMFWDDEVDFVLPASEYYDRINSIKK